MVRVFCDFDGTAVAKDIGNELFRTFAGPKASTIAHRYLSGDLTARECLTQECAAVDHVTPERLSSFVDQFTLDPHFIDFLLFCEMREIPVTILSDGFDFYVERLLTKHGTGHIPWFANHLEFHQVGNSLKMVPSFAYTDSECEWCGNCKRNHMLTMSGDDDIIVYVGDDISDRCPVRFADIVFATRGLIKYCQEQNITYFEFETFRDVQERLEKIHQRKRIKKRREAEMARREVFMQG